MVFFNLSGIFSVIPQKIYTKECGEKIINQQFNIGDNLQIKAIPLSNFNSVLVYAVPSNLINENNSNKTEILPLIVKILEELKTIQHHNKIVFHFSKEYNITHIVISIGNELKLINSFKSDSFETSLYYLFLALKQFQINPIQTTIRLCFQINENQNKIILKYFKGIEYSNNFNDIKVL